LKRRPGEGIGVRYDANANIHAEHQEGGVESLSEASAEMGTVEVAESAALTPARSMSGSQTLG
jgi:hypothetical protein